MTITVANWWTILCVIAATNVLAWAISGFLMIRHRASWSSETYEARRRQFLLCGIYVMGCAFRSVIPVFDVPRLCVLDSPLSSVFIGRSVATVAELCFVAQWALRLRESADFSGSAFARTVARALVPLIAVAEIFSWYSVLTTSNIGHVVEESLWGLSATLVVASMLAPPARLHLRYPVLIVWGTLGLAYAAYMFLVDVPMYWRRWLADEAAGRLYFTIVEGIRDAWSRCTISHRPEDWQSEFVWMTLYFSVAVWLSISLIHHAPAPQRTRTSEGAIGRRGAAALRREE